MFYLGWINQRVAHNLTHQNKETAAIVIGARIVGLRSALRLANKGVHVTVLEQQDTYGGKMGVWEQDGYDTGPSLFTMLKYVKEQLSFVRPILAVNTKDYTSVEEVYILEVEYRYVCSQGK